MRYIKDHLACFRENSFEFETLRYIEIYMTFMNTIIIYTYI